jgi:cellulose synthase/poly-beta-1,6-N-acetylglucosamine synthase-like glycosyltransferase
MLNLNVRVDTTNASEHSSSGICSPSTLNTANRLALPQRGISRIRPWVTGFAMLALMGMFAFVAYDHVTKIIHNHAPLHALIFILYPLGFMYVSFPVSTIVSSLYIMFGSVRCLVQNTRYYSALQTPLHPHTTPISLTREGSSGTPPFSPLAAGPLSIDNVRGRSFVGAVRQFSVASLASVPAPPESARIALPPVLIQMPVYKESLRSVIAPSCESLKEAMRHYREAGGFVELLVCDDGLQCMSRERADKRVAYYRRHFISYVARPKDDRPGTFKKASNMNYAYKACECCGELDGCESYGLHPVSDNTLVLLVDADTRVPASCITDTVAEFMYDGSDRLAFTQHFTTPFRLAAEGEGSSYWYNIIAFFTEKIYFMGIAFSTAMGGACPLVGHNAFIRYRCIKEVGGWNEQCVSEDYDMFLRLASAGYHGRFVMYTGSDFKEGVSTRFIDEVRKFQRFTYGACEMCINPLKRWPCEGPLAKGFIQFLGSSLTWHDKFNTLFYLSTYFAMSSAFYFTLAEAVCNIVVPDFFSTYMTRAFDVMIACLFVYGGCSTLAQVVFDIKAFKYPKGTSIVSVLWDEVKWLPFIAIFFSSIMYHMTETALCYLLSIPIRWGATEKSTGGHSALQALKNTIVNFWRMYAVLTSLLAAYIVCDVLYDLPMYYGWTVYYYCGAHLLGPILLHPDIMLLRT